VTGRHLTLEDAEKIFLIRRLLEAYAFEEAAQRASKQQIEELGYLQMVDAARAIDLQRYVQNGLEGHRTV